MKKICRKKNSFKLKIQIIRKLLKKIKPERFHFITFSGFTDGKTVTLIIIRT